MSRRKKISQREAVRLRRRVVELEDRIEKERSYWSGTYPGTGIGEFGPFNEKLIATVKTARRLGFAVLVVDLDADRLSFRACPMAVSS